MSKASNEHHKCQLMKSNIMSLDLAPEKMMFTGLRAVAAAPTPPGTPAWRVTAALLRLPVTCG
eukprot:scaffold64909_cov28-Tisochrysis_lutea.AAC.2